ncbi:MAG: hypothetical protein C0591_08970 [Marinilabiliales bacterium]|nr:MAG: hypothetical protein C0591_08970 [Marinilabiliales bacterium]
MMKTKIIKSLMLTILCTGCYGISLLHSQTCNVTFQADFSEAIIENPTTVGIRGSVAPLSWTETMIMEDKNGDGIYTLQVAFENFKPGTEASYKYVHGNVVWENDLLGAIGNRSIYLYEGKNKLPVDKWDHLDKYSSTSLLEAAITGKFWDWVYIIGSDKQNGLSPEEIGLKLTAFWGSMKWLESPQILLGWEKTSQAMYPNGYFETIENTPEKVVFKARKTWLNYYGDEDQIMNVTRDDMTLVFKTNTEAIAMAKGWKCKWEDEEDFFKVTIEK